MKNRCFMTTTLRKRCAFHFTGSACFLILLLAEAGTVHADAFRNPFQDAAAIGQGTAFIAQADDPSAIHYNPAGMTRLPGIQHSIGVELVSLTNKFRSPSGQTATGNLKSQIGFPPPGQLFLTANLGDLGVHSAQNLSIGLGVESLYGFLIRFPPDGPFATAVTSATLPLLDIKPTVAYKITDDLSVGLGADIFTLVSFLGEGHFEQKFVWPGGLGVPPGARAEINGSGTTAGINASVLYTPLRTLQGKPRLNLGFIWRSQAVLPLNGEFRADGALIANASSSLRLPESYSGGVAVWAVRNAGHEWKLEGDVDFVRWQSMRNQDIAFSNGTSIPNPQFWKNAVTVSVGTEYKRLMLPGHPAWDLALRGGYIRSATPIPDVNFNPSIADANVNNYTAGIGFLCKPPGLFLGIIRCGSETRSALSRSAIGMDFAYAAIVFEPRTVTGSPNPTVNGSYHTRTHVGAVTVRINF
jgi:long-chain fatty acid transport protein